MMKRYPAIFTILLLSILFVSSVRAETVPSVSPKSSKNFPDKPLIYQVDSWIVEKIFPQEELIPGIGYRTTALLSQGEVTRKAYCLDPGMTIPPVGTQCILKPNGDFDCGGQYQRFRELPNEATPTPTPTPTPQPETFDCAQLGLGLQVTYGKPPISDLQLNQLVKNNRPWRDFLLDPLAVAPEEVWNNDPIRMFYPSKTCGRFTVHGVPGGLPVEVVKVEVTVDCPGLHVDLSTESADGGYCFDCRDIDFSQKLCTVTNKLTVQKGEQSFVCQGFYKVIDPIMKIAQQNFAETAFILIRPYSPRSLAKQ